MVSASYMDKIFCCVCFSIYSLSDIILGVPEIFCLTGSQLATIKGLKNIGIFHIGILPITALFLAFCIFKCILKFYMGYYLVL